MALADSRGRLSALVPITFSVIAGLVAWSCGATVWRQTRRRPLERLLGIALAANGVVVFVSLLIEGFVLAARGELP
jgi:hypothetical protein